MKQYLSGKLRPCRDAGGYVRLGCRTEIRGLSRLRELPELTGEFNWMAIAPALSAARNFSDRQLLTKALSHHQVQSTPRSFEGSCNVLILTFGSRIPALYTHMNYYCSSSERRKCPLLVRRRQPKMRRMGPRRPLHRRSPLAIRNSTSRSSSLSPPNNRSYFCSPSHPTSASTS